MRRRAGQGDGGVGGPPPDEYAPTPALLDMRAQLERMHGQMWGRRN